ncbi:endonuclease/exonuclease/phosphatase family protein [Marivirga sp.]|uniref:endonuclease/exonuclease/phosphatase family protein n=1 Tax=Marivirga sp. TaxID=2018662 RepID=UPI003DA78C5D
MKNIFFYVNFLLLLLFILLFISSFINPYNIPIGNLSSVFLPFVAIFILFYFLILIIINYSKKWLYIAGISIASFALNKSYFLNFESSKIEQENIKILSYNVSFFSVKKVFKKDYFDSSKNKEVQLIRQFAHKESPDVMCLQEFFNDENSTIYNSIERFEKLGYHYFLKSKPRHDNGLNRGLITFSKYPIINSDIIAESNREYNGAILTDLKISEKDTIRLINVHLTSMELNKGSKSWIEFIKPFYSAYTTATVERINQLEDIMSYIKNCPYKVILVGDFNETQYSYLYKSIKSLMNNSFEEKGNGLGITFPFKIPGVGVRIDHMFYTPAIEIIDFNTLTDLEHSEHKPIIGTFKIK